jgi:pimeloyl-ACP methyl ester carboxylesterase
MAPLVDVEEGNRASIRQAREIFETTAWRRKLERHHDHPIEQVFSGWNDTWLDDGFREWSIAPDLAAIRCPVLALGGADDPYSSPRQLELVRSHAGGPVEVVLLPGCGHVPYRDEPHAVLAAIAAFVDRLR